MLEHLNPNPVKPSRVVVIGAGGFVGGAIRKKLTAEGVNTLALTRKEMDLLADDAAARLRELLQPTDSVVMVSAVAPAKTIPDLMQNLKMAEAVCEVLAAATVAHLVYISSDAVYADDANPVNERSYCAPSTLHGMMHAARELMLKSSTHAPFAALRPTLIYGAADPHNGYGPNRFRRQAAKGEPITLFGEGEERRDHVAIEDVAALVALVLAHRSAGVLNVATGVSTSFHDIAHMTAALFSNMVPVKSTPRQGPRPHLTHRFFDITDCLKAFPDFHYTPLSKGLFLAKQAA
ncbi:MAG TPA: NAD-dependent epimerase/dehydratase family protein [Burkholderiales bacterium]|nr:NAD-dependent epimerase/dehydratase family protein [Burkholderiales bacterium]